MVDCRRASARAWRRRVALAVLIAGVCLLIEAPGALAAFSWSSVTPVGPDFRVNSFNPATPLSCASSTFCVAVGSGTMNGNYSDEAETYDGTNWSAPQQLSDVNQLMSVSCASTTFCVAGDESGGVVTYNGTSWSGPSGVDGTNQILSMSCLSSSFCEASDANGTVLTFDGSGWASDPLDTANGLGGVSCASTSFCVAVDYAGNVLTTSDPTDGSSATWSTPSHIDGTNSFTGVSCTSSSFCAAVDDHGNAFTYNGTTWSSASIDSGHQLWAVDCLSSTLCVAGDRDVTAFVYNGSGWTSHTIDGTQGVGCASNLDCVVTDGFNSFKYNGSGWTGPTTQGLNGLGSISCGSATFCVAADGNGSVVTTTDGSNWATTRVDSEYVISSISCPSTSFCAAVDREGQFGQDGNAFTFDGSWSTPPASPIDTNALAGFQSVSCPSASFCAAIDFTSNAVTYNNGSWSSPVLVDPSGLYTVSCASATFCVAAGSNVSMYDGSSWSAPAPVDPTNAIYSISCPSASFCAGADSDGNVLTWNGSNWSTTTVDANNSFNTISCPSAQFCAAVDDLGNTFTFNGHAWSDPVTVANVNNLYGLSCTATGLCYATDGYNRILRGQLPAPSNSTLPGISGTATEGQTLTETQGSWANAPSSFAEQWEDCDSGGGACSDIGGATGGTYTLKSSDVGHTIRVVETATNVAGSAPASSSATAIVQAAPGGSTGSGGTPPTGSPSGTNSVTATEILASLLAQLSPTGKPAKIAALLRAGGYPSAFKALTAGGLRIGWYFLPKGAHLAKAKPVLVASGGTTFSAAGIRTLKIKVTSAGKRLLRHATRLRVTAKGTFTPAGGAAITARKSFTLKR